MKASFAPGSNVLHTSNPYLHFEMSATAGGYFQTAVENAGPTNTLTRSERMDIATGLPRKGQTYLFWKGDELFQLPVSYWVEANTWVNSPSYPDGSPHFDKPVVARCLECHASYFDWVPPEANRYKTSSLVLGIDCERCHGPGRKHMIQERSKSPTKSAASDAIVNPAHLSRDRQIDLCALCHSGAGEPIGPSLTFVAGDVLDDYLFVPNADAHDAPDVHGNQVQLLKRSKCFQSTTTLTCTTCHNVHATQRDAASFSSHCLTCHAPRQCGQFAKLGDAIARDCVDCHMPLQESQVLFSESNGRKLRPMVRTHKIGIYPDARMP
jgi:hypothetical protein